MGGVHAHPRPGGVGQQPGIEQLLVVVPVDAGGEGGMAAGVGRILEGLGQSGGAGHAGALAVDRVAAGEGEPGFVPQEHKVRLDRQAFEHDALDVVDDAVEGAVGQQHHANAVQRAGAAKAQQRFLDVAQRHRAVHREFIQRIGVQVGHLRAGQHQAVVVRLVAVPVHQHDVVGLDQRLHHDLVAGGRAVGGEVVRRAPKARAAYSWASFSGPTGSSSESRPPEVADVSAMNRFMP